MGLTMHLFGVESEHGKTPVGHGIIRTMYEVGYWRKAWIILYWFGREFEIEDDTECITLNTKNSLQHRLTTLRLKKER